MFVPLITLLSLAATDPGEFSLSWKVPCAPAPDATELVGAVNGSVEVELAPSDQGWALVVRYLSPAMGERAMKTSTCEEGAQAAVLLIRLAMRSQPSPPRQPRLSTQPPDPTAIVPVEAPLPVRLPDLSLSVSALAQHGPLPTIASRLGVTLGLEWPDAWTGLLSLRVGLRTVVPGGPTPQALVLVQPILGAQLSGCWQPRAGRFSGGPCAVLGAEAWDVSSENVSHPHTSTGVSIAAGLDARGALQLWQGLSVTAALGARVALLRPRVFFKDSGIVFQAGAYSVEGELGLRWAW